MTQDLELEKEEPQVQVLSIGLMVCDIPLKAVPQNIFKLDKCDIAAPIPGTGGDALNVAIALSKLNIKVSLAGRIGEDANGDFILNEAKRRGVDVTQVIRDQTCGTAVSYIIIEESGERHFLCASKIHSRLTAEDVTEEAIKAADIVFFGSAMVMEKMDQGGIWELFKKAHKYGKITAMDTAMDNFREGKEERFHQLENALYETDIFLPSYEEAKLLTGFHDIEKIAGALKKYAIKHLIIKMGSKGCYITDFINSIQIDAYKNFDVNDTTGAGDSFVGGFLCGFLHGWDMEQCGIFANGVAAHSVSVVGATNGIPDFDEAVAFVKKNKAFLTKIRKPFI